MKKLLYDFDNEAIAVRYFSPDGHYPMFNLQNKDYVLKFDREKNILYSAVKLKPFDLHYYQSGTTWAFISEIRLWSAMTLSVHPADGKYVFAPLDHPLVFNEKNFNDNYSSVIAEAIRGLNACTIRSPTISNEYEFHHLITDEELIQRLFLGIDPENKILLRSLSCLLKSSLLSQSRLAIEEAALLCYISLEGAMNLLRQKLNISKLNEVYKYIEDNIPSGKTLADYHRQCRNNRNVLAHPDSTLTDDLLPILSTEDYFETYQTLVELYRFIVLGIPISNDY